MTAPEREVRRARSGVAYRIEGSGPSLLLLHGLMASGEMFDPLVERLRDGFRLVVPDLRGHGLSGDLPGPYDVTTCVADLEELLSEADFGCGGVLGYSHGGAAAQLLARRHPERVSRLILGGAYACNVSSARERLEAAAIVGVLTFATPRSLAGFVVRAGARDLDPATADWLIGIMGANGRRQMREAARELARFDSRPWLGAIRAPTFVIAGAKDAAVPARHFERLVYGIPGAVGTVIQGAGHAMIWTHAEPFADLVRRAAGPLGWESGPALG